MVVVLAGAALLVGYASVASLVTYLPLLALAESLSPRQVQLRTRLWLLGLLLPVAAGLLAGIWSLVRHLAHPLFSPHADRWRPHLCVRLLVEGPDGPWRLQLFVWVCLLLVAAAGIYLLASLVRSAWEGHQVRRQGHRQPGPDWAGEVEMWELPTAGLASHRSLAPLVVYNPRLQHLFPGEQSQAILAHEVCHARRRDNLLAALAGFALLLQAFSPLAYLCYRNWLLTREMACDLYAARLTSGKVTEAALATAQDLTHGLEELRPLSPPGRAVGAHLSQRREYLRSWGEQTLAPPGGRADLAIVFGILTLLAAGLVAVATLPQLPDTFHCAAETLLDALAR